MFAIANDNAIHYAKYTIRVVKVRYSNGRNKLMIILNE